MLINEKCEMYIEEIYALAHFKLNFTTNGIGNNNGSLRIMYTKRI